MPRLLALSLAGFVGLAATAGPPSRLPAPKVEEADGRKVARIVYGKHSPTVTVGPLEFTLDPMTADRSGRPMLSWLVTNRSNAEVDTAGKLPNLRGSLAALQDDTGRPYRSLDGKDGPGDKILGPGRQMRYEALLSPELNRAAKSLTAELDAPQGSAADRWLVIFPRPTWAARLPDAR